MVALVSSMPVIGIGIVVTSTGTGGGGDVAFGYAITTMLLFVYI